MLKPLLLVVVLVLGFMVVSLLGQAGAQQARLEILYLRTELLQQQNHTLAARQALLDREKENLLSQNQQMQQHLASLQAAYQQARTQNRQLQAVITVAGQLKNVNWSIIFWLGLVGLLTMATVVLAAFVIARRIGPRLNESSGAQPEGPAAETPWASPEYRHLAIQKARKIEQWERQSVLAYLNPHRTSMPTYQETTSTNLR